MSTEFEKVEGQPTRAPFCGWCGQQLIASGGQFVHTDGTTTAGQCAKPIIDRSRGNDASEKRG
jgi:hypothetical protein